MNIQGKVVRVLPAVPVGTAQKREIHVQTDLDSKYPQTLQMEAYGDKVDLLNGINPNDEVSFEINLRGREWTGSDGVIKVFNTLSIWKVDVKSATANAPTAPATDIPF